MVARRLFSLAVLAAFGCATPDVSPPPVNALTCAAGELVVQGALGGPATTLREPATGNGFINKIGKTPGTLQASGANAAFSFEFDTPVGSGQPAAARGFVRVKDPLVDLGNCPTGPYDSEVSYTAGNPAVYRFTLRAGRKPPYCVYNDPGAALEGCVGIGR